VKEASFVTLILQRYHPQTARDLRGSDGPTSVRTGQACRILDIEAASLTRQPGQTRACFNLKEGNLEDTAGTPGPFKSISSGRRRLVHVQAFDL